MRDVVVILIWKFNIVEPCLTIIYDVLCYVDIINLRKILLIQTKLIRLGLIWYCFFFFYPKYLRIMLFSQTKLTHLDLVWYIFLFK